MKILITNGHLQVGGVEKSLINLLNTIDYSKNEVDLLLFEGYGEYRDLVPKEVNVILCDTTRTYGSFFSVIKKAIMKRDMRSLAMKVIFTFANKITMRSMSLMKWFRLVTKEYDYAFAYRVGISADFVAYAVKAKVKCVWWHHGQIDNSERQVIHWKKMMKQMNRIICVSEAARNIISPYFKEYADKMIVISNIINCKEIKQKAKLFHPYEKIEADIIKIVSVGRFSPEKHMLDTVIVLKRLIEKGYYIHWFLVGDGPERKKIEEKIHELDIVQYMTLVGKCSNPYPYINDADIFVHPSFVESQGLTVLEAMVLHKICVVVESAGTNEFIINGKNAIQAEQNIDSLTENIEYALRNKELIQYEQQDLTIAQFSPQKIINQILLL